MSMLARQVDPGATMDGVNVVPMSAALGAEICGINLSAPLGNAAFAAIHDALMRYQVIFFRDQDLSVDAQVAFASRFGEPTLSKKLPMYDDNHPTVSLLENDGSKIAVGGVWHTDNTDFIEPPLGSVLYAEVVPAYGGDTVWSSLPAAFEALAPGLQKYLLTLTAQHDNSQVKRLYGGDANMRAATRTVEAPSEHPVVRRHPVTGRSCLFVNPLYTTRIVGVSDVESRHLLALLYEHMARPEFQVRFRWAARSLAIWDNRATQHYALDDYDQLRRMRRVQLVGDVPQPVT